MKIYSSKKEDYNHNDRIEVSVIIINYNQSLLTIDCVKSIYEKTKDVKFEVIVIDNYSVNPTEQNALKTLLSFDNFTLVLSRQNLGFGLGNNIAAQFSDPTSKYLFFLNNDTWLLNNTIEQLTDFMNRHIKASIVGPAMFKPNGEQVRSFHYLPYARRFILGDGLVRKLWPSVFINTKQVYVSPIKVQYVSGAAMFVRAETFKQIGGFDPTFFLYYEEEDLCKRTSDAGFDVWFLPSAKYAHIGFASTNNNSSMKIEAFLSMMHYLRKHKNFGSRLVFRIVYIFKSLRKSIKDPIYKSILKMLILGDKPNKSIRFK